MSENIKAGDLVMVVRGHTCTLDKWGGIPVLVTGFVPQVGGGWECSRCGKRDIAPEEKFAAMFDDTGRGAPVGWLKKLDGLSSPESIEHNEATA